ncbi:hypothetical protein [Parvularcula lutaonensis]|uniref:VPLPA-CTERM sorting domain-containing protein n=1 Tax=Parvularcula lutaonensis TaxID=491923 RepID=A0ABV7MF04_9PROT|nr:hypothetical protein [Parvularcula lutaonensis]GGY52236.1 hypothetical protein GCM10007148_21660 [Parvularcula lutaonensis]
MRLYGLILSIAASLALGGAAHGAMVIGVVEEFGDVKFRFSGSLELSGVPLLDSNSADTREQGFLGPRDGSFVNLPLFPFSDGTRPYDIYAASRLARFGSQTPIRGKARGDAFGITSSGKLLVPAGYSSGETISGELVFFGTSLRALGLAVGTFSASLAAGDGQITLVIPSPDGQGAINPVPLPAGALLFLTGGALVLANRRRP